jgi:hypothetical protein
MSVEISRSISTLAAEHNERTERLAKGIEGDVLGKPLPPRAEIIEIVTPRNVRGSVTEVYTKQ